MLKIFLRLTLSLLMAFVCVISSHNSNSYKDIETNESYTMSSDSNDPLDMDNKI
jgi:hypothetical protein